MENGGKQDLAIKGRQENNTVKEDRTQQVENGCMGRSEFVYMDLYTQVEMIGGVL